MKCTIHKYITVLLFFASVSTLNAEPLSNIEIAGKLTLHSDIEGQESSRLISYIRGHSWLGFQSLDGANSWTVGTWDEGIKIGNQISRKGVNFNLEAKRHPGAYRRIDITKDQYVKLTKAIIRHDEWTSIKNCSLFASAVWNEVTGENLTNWSPIQDRELREFVLGNEFGVSRTIPLPSPSGLFDWIFISNHNKFNNDNNALRTTYERDNLTAK